MSERKAKNTNRATKQWMNALTDYLKEKELGLIEGIATSDLPSILGDFYFSIRKQKKKEPTVKRKRLQLPHSEPEYDKKYYKKQFLEIS